MMCGIWLNLEVDDQLRYPNPKILLSNGNAHIRTQGNLLWAITQMYFALLFVSLVHAASAICSQDHSGDRFYCPVCPGCNAVSRHSLGHGLK